MLGLVDNQLVSFEPVLRTGTDFRVSYGCNGAGEGRVRVFYAGALLEAGVQFYLMDGKADLNPRTGEFKLRSTKARVRAIFAGRHHDVEITR